MTALANCHRGAFYEDSNGLLWKCMGAGPWLPMALVPAGKPHYPPLPVRLVYDEYGYAVTIGHGPSDGGMYGAKDKTR